MTSRDRVLAALNHSQPDKMAVDFGGMNCSTMHVSCVDELRRHYGLEERNVRVQDVFTMAGYLEDDLQDVLGADCHQVTPPGSLFGFPQKDWKVWTNPDGLEVMVPGSFNPQPDGDGGLLVYPRGDLSAPPSGRMPRGCVYFDAVLRNEPIEESRMNPEDNLEEFREFTDEDLAYIKEGIDRGYERGRAVVALMPGLGLGDAAEIPGCSLRHPKGIRDYTEWYMAPYLYPDYVHALFERQMEIGIRNMEKVLDICEDKIDVAYTCAADLASQNSLFVSPETFREFYRPYYRKANSWIHGNTRWKILKHCCGAVEPLIGDLIDCGFDALNPVQTNAAGMDPDHLKREYGKDISFWGGGVDTQKELPFGSPEEVRRQVLERCDVFARGGGYIFNSIHIVQRGTPVENIVAMVEAVREFNGD